MKKYFNLCWLSHSLTWSFWIQTRTGPGVTVGRIWWRSLKDGHGAGLFSRTDREYPWEKQGRRAMNSYSCVQSYRTEPLPVSRWVSWAWNLALGYKWLTEALEGYLMIIRLSNQNARLERRYICCLSMKFCASGDINFDKIWAELVRSRVEKFFWKKFPSCQKVL